jgi:hypothetical protein
MNSGYKGYLVEKDVRETGLLDNKFREKDIFIFKLPNI